jgi:predicted RNase H-like HicB family nuclease
MLIEYVEAAMRRAEFKVLDEDQTYWGEIPGFQGVWANEATEEACRRELRSALEDWILLGVSRQDTLPVIDGLDLNIREVA